jgi:hypothetical protein
METPVTGAKQFHSAYPFFAQAQSPPLGQVRIHPFASRLILGGFAQLPARE